MARPHTQEEALLVLVEDIEKTQQGLGDDSFGDRRLSAVLNAIRGQIKYALSIQEEPCRCG